MAGTQADEHISRNNIGATMQRRGILAAAAAVVAGIVAKQAAQPVAAFNQLNLETTNTVSSAATILNVVSGYATQSVLQVDASASSTQAASYIDAIRAVGAYNGSGVWGTGGNATNTGGGVSFAGDGLFGQGGRGGSSNGIVRPGAPGVYGIGGDNAGGGGSGGEGVRAIGGNATGSGNGGYGVYATPGTGMPTSGVYALNLNGGAGNTGVTGVCTGTNAIGVFGQSATGYGVLGYSTGGAASLAGISTNVNIPAFAGGNSQPNGLAAHFDGTVYVNGRLVVTDPSYKSGALAHPDGSHRLVYCVESPESWIEDVGSGTLSNGKATVTFDKDFAAITHTDSYHVFLTSYDAANKGLAVTNRSATGFTVQEQQGGTSDGAFSWKVMVKAKSTVKSDRLAKFTVPNVPLPDISKLAQAPSPPVRPPSRKP